MTDRVPNRWRRFDVWDERPLRLDSFAEESPVDGFCAVASPFDPTPSLIIDGDTIVEMDGVRREDFDMIDTFIARHHIDRMVAAEAMTTDSAAFARDMVDVNVPRADLVRLAKGMTPAKLAEVFGHLSTLELTFAQAKLRSRREPGIQAHVTNAKDDPLQLVADAATAGLLGFDEIETTVRVASNGWSNALAGMVGAAVAGGVLFQCSIEEAEELRLGLAGLTSYAETVSVYGSEESFIDGDDTPWSKAFLIAAYASRGIKTRCTSGGGAEILMGSHNTKSVLYLEARCLCVQRAMGSQGTQNGGIDGAPVTSSLPGGGREILAENVMAALLDLECASGNDTRISSSEIRVGGKIMPFLMAGTDFICSGFGSIPAYDNSFAASLFNGEEVEDYLALQRDFQLEGGLRPIEESETNDIRTRAVEALAAVFEELELAEITDAMKRSAIYASGSQETDTFTPGEVTRIANKIRERGLSLVDVVRALNKRGFSAEAETLTRLLRLRVAGDYLQTAAIVRGGRVISAVNDPNGYSGPGTGHRMTEQRWRKIAAIRNSVNRASVLDREIRVAASSAAKSRCRLVSKGPAGVGTAPHEVVIGVSPAWNERIFQTTAGHAHADVLKAIFAGIIEGGGTPRLVRIFYTADTSFLGLSAARLSGSGYGIGLQAKGTAVIHQKDRLPHHNVELFSTAPITSIDHYRRLGRNAARLSHGEMPEPVVVPYDGQAIHARNHVRTALLYAIEVGTIDKAASPIELSVEFLEGSGR